MSCSESYVVVYIATLKRQCHDLARDGKVLNTHVIV